MSGIFSDSINYLYDHSSIEVKFRVGRLSPNPQKRNDHKNDYYDGIDDCPCFRKSLSRAFEIQHLWHIICNPIIDYGKDENEKSLLLTFCCV